MRADAQRSVSPELIGRSDEMAVLAAAVERMKEGRPSIAIVGGEAGMGKTRLVEAFGAATPNVRFLYGSCLAFGAATPYLPLAEILRDLLGRLRGDDIDEVVGPARSELARFMPELATSKTISGPKASMSGDLERLRMYEALLRVTEHVALDYPTAFVVEDVQWVDPASLQLLSFLTHSIARGKMMLIVTVRSDVLERYPDVATFLVDLERQPEVDRIELGPLDRDDVRRQVEAIRGAPEAATMVERVVALGGGNPLYTEELLNAVGPEGDVDLGAPRLRDLIGARIGRLPASALPVLRVASIGGRSIDAKRIAIVLDSDEPTVGRALDAAIDGELLARGLDQGEGLRFRQEVVRVVVASQLGGAEARRIHAAYADAIEADDPGTSAIAELAFHRDAAEQTAAAVVAHARSARSAEVALAYADAHGHYRRVLEGWSALDDAPSTVGATHAQVRFSAAAAAARSGSYDEAVDLARALVADDGEGDAGLFELARSSLRWYLWEAGRVDEALDAARSVLQDDATPDLWRANALVHLAALAMLRGELDVARGSAEQARSEAEAIGALAEHAMADGVLGWCLILGGDIEDGLTRIRHAVHLAAELEVRRDAADASVAVVDRYPTGRVLAYAQLASALVLAGRFEEAAAAAREGLEVASAQGVVRSYGPRLVLAVADAYYAAGDWDGAHDVLVTSTPDAVGSWRPVLLATQATIAASRDQGGTADVLLARAERDAPGDLRPEAVRRMALARAEGAAWRRQPQEALMALQAALEPGASGETTSQPGRLMDLDIVIPRAVAVGARAAADLMMSARAGKVSEMLATLALERVHDSIERVRGRPGLSSLWAADLALAEAELARGDQGPVPGTAEAWSKAADAHAGRPYGEAYARWRLAEALFGDRERRQAAETELARAWDLARSLRAGPLVGAIDELAGRAGVRPDGSTTARREDRPYGLTVRELEVLLLLADGRSNAEIAEELFISPKTASVHVSNIYGKLGVESRVAAATMAHELGLDVTPATGGTEADDEERTLR